MVGKIHRNLSAVLFVFNVNTGSLVNFFLSALYVRMAHCIDFRHDLRAESSFGVRVDKDFS